MRQPKFPSFFRLPKAQRFDYEPLYYDPVKEELDERKKKIAAMQKKGIKDSGTSPLSISEAFSRRNRNARKANVLQMVIIVCLLVSTIGYIFYGNIAIFTAIGIAMLYYLSKRIKI